jgi:hypothetical protein
VRCFISIKALKDLLLFVRISIWLYYEDKRCNHVKRGTVNLFLFLYDEEEKEDSFKFT